MKALAGAASWVAAGPASWEALIGVSLRVVRR
jgi:hypothetical protein